MKKLASGPQLKSMSTCLRSFPSQYAPPRKKPSREKAVVWSNLRGETPSGDLESFDVFAPVSAIKLLTV